MLHNATGPSSTLSGFVLKHAIRHGDVRLRKFCRDEYVAWRLIAAASTRRQISPMSDLDRRTKKKSGRPRKSGNEPDPSTPVRVLTPNGAISVGVRSSARIEQPRPQKRYTYQLIASSDRRRLSGVANISPAAFVEFIDQVELSVFEWQSARMSKNAYFDAEVQKILLSLAGTLRRLDKHSRFPASIPKEKVAERTPQHQRVDQALQPILELIWPGWTDQRHPDFRRALEAIKAASGIGIMGPKHQSKPHAVAAAERLAMAWRKCSKLPLSGGSEEKTLQGYLTVLLSEIDVYEPYGLISARPKRVPRAVLAAFQEEVIGRELALTIDRIRDRTR